MRTKPKTMSFGGNGYLILSGPTRKKPGIELFAATTRWICDRKACGPRLRFEWETIDPRPRAQCGGPPPEPDTVSILPPRYVQQRKFNSRKEKRRFDWLSVLNSRIPGSHAQYHPAYLAACVGCQATGFALEPVTLLCAKCAEKRITRLCERCGNFIQDEVLCICHERLTVDAVYVGQDQNDHPLFKSSLSGLYCLIMHPYGYLDLEIRLANAGLRDVREINVDGRMMWERATNVLLRKET